MTQPPPREPRDRSVLQHVAARAMVERGLRPAFSGLVMTEVRALPGEGAAATKSRGAEVRDLTHLPWASIDNDSSRDLDQLSVAEALPDDGIRVLVAVADVDALVARDSAVDEHARHNTTSVYTAAAIFPMLPERLSTDLTSLNAGHDRLAVVADMVVAADGALRTSTVYRARVRNQAKLAYDSTAAWLDGEGPVPAPIPAVDGLAENLRLQDRAAKRLRQLRHENGALSLQTVQARPVFEGEGIRDLAVETKNRAKELIEDFMVAANGVTARFLSAHAFPSIRRVVRTPKRWDRLVALAGEHGTPLPATPDPAALDAFLVQQRAVDPVRFVDLSLSVVKLLGAGEYVAEQPGAAPPGHFGLAVKDYTHSTAPNRRYADLITQRLVKAALAAQPAPYSFAELDALARHITLMEDAANKVERQVAKAAAAILLGSRIGDRFDAIVTGASPKGTWVRLLGLPAEGRVVRGADGMDVAERVRVQLVATDVERGFIDFAGVPAHGR